mmetsp:Transcript_3559/g.7786  ORF Transcript_3559/g.7786 Transcript_3559/m.7786 type:complete len:81 (+) Transcript_3559:315-557(+)
MPAANNTLVFDLLHTSFNKRTTKVWRTRDPPVWARAFSIKTDKEIKVKLAIIPTTPDPITGHEIAIHARKAAAIMKAKAP